MSSLAVGDLKGRMQRVLLYGFAMLLCVMSVVTLPQLGTVARAAGTITYSVSITGGTGAVSGSAVPSKTLIYTANPTGYREGKYIHLYRGAAPEGKVFDHWNAQVTYEFQIGNGLRPRKVSCSYSEDFTDNVFQTDVTKFTASERNLMNAALGNDTDVSCTIQISAVYDDLNATISFDGNGAESGSMAPVTVTNHAEYILPSCSFSREHYDFKGWKLQGDDTVYSPRQSVEINGDTTITAQWMAKEYLIYLYSHNGISAGGGTYPYGTEVTVSSQPRSSDWGFHSWREDGEIVSEEAEYTFTVTGPRELEAYYLPIYRLIFKANGGEGTMPALQALAYESIVLPECSFTRAGYSFGGWTLYNIGETEQIGDILQPGEIVVMNLGNLIVKPVWEELPYFVEINETNFPDGHVRSLVAVKEIDQNEDGKLSAAELAAVKTLSWNEQSISDLTGVEHFTELTSLSVSSNQLTWVDLSSNKKLKDFVCTYNQLTELSLSENTELKYLFCFSNQLTSLDLRANTALVRVTCSDNPLQSLQVGGRTTLEKLECYNTEIEALDVSGFTALDKLDCDDCALKSLNVSGCTNLTLIHSENNPGLVITGLADCTKLRTLYCEGCKMGSLDVSANTALEILYCSDNQLTSLDITKNENLLYFACLNNQLTSIDLSCNTDLREVLLDGNQLGELSLAGLEKLEKLCVIDNELTNLDLSDNPLLSYLDITENPIESLDVSGCDALKAGGEGTLLVEEGVTLYESPVEKCTVTLLASPEDMGSVTGSGAWIAGENVTVKATPADGYGFVAWKKEGRIVSTENTYVFTAVENVTLTAVFDRTDLFKLAGANMNLGNALAMNFYVRKSNIDTTKDYYVEITKQYADGRVNAVRRIPFSKWSDYNENLYKVSFNGIAAREMNDRITIQVCYADETPVSQIWVDSIVDYVTRALDSQTPGVQRAMVDMLNYGAEAQKAFHYDEGRLANGNLSETQRGYASLDVTPENKQVMDTNYKGSNLNLGSNLCLNMYFLNLDPSEYTNMYAILNYKNHNGKECSIRVNGSNFMEYSSTLTNVRVEVLAVAEVGSLVTCTVYDMENNKLAKGSDSIESYIARQTTPSDLFKAIMRFSSSSYKVFHP